MLHRFMRAAALAVGSASLVLACSSTVVIDSRDTKGKVESPALPATTAPPAPPLVTWCVAADDMCEKGGEACCAGLYCDDSGYGFGFCRPPQPSGGYCEDGAACQSGICHQYVCVDELPACVGLGDYCADGAPCCEGYCLPLSYAPNSGTCAPLLEAGAYCVEGSECQSGNCELNLCRTADCSGVGAFCESDATCCGGFCSGGPYSYAPGACTAPQPAGAYCETWLWCESTSCVDSICTP